MKRRGAGALLTNALRALVREELRRMRSEVEDGLLARLSVNLDALTARMQRLEQPELPLRQRCQKCGKTFNLPHLYDAHMLAETAIDENAP